MPIYGDSIFLNEGLFDKYKEKKAKKVALNDAKWLVENTAKWIKSPYTLGDGYDFHILWLFTKIYSFDELAKFCVKNKAKFEKYGVDKVFFGDDEDLKGIANRFKRFIGQVATVILFNDDYTLCLGINGKLYNCYISDEHITLLSPKDINPNDDDYIMYDLSTIKEIDKELGTNLFSKEN